jgi:hypothetical protein
MENKLKEIINKIVREEIMGEDNTAFVTTAKGREAVSYKDTKELDAIKGNADVKGIETAGGQKLKEMARAAEVKYSLKSDFRGELESVQSKLSKSEFRSLVDIVKVLKDKGEALTATDILKFHNEANPDRQYASQQSFIRPLVLVQLERKKYHMMNCHLVPRKKMCQQDLKKRLVWLLHLKTVVQNSVVILSILLLLKLIQITSYLLIELNWLPKH